jgi:hypothetical protein
MNHAIPELDRKGLRDFAFTTGGIVAVLFGLFFPWLLEGAFPIWPWIVAAVLAFWALVAPLSLKPVYRGWMRFGLLLSRITTPIIMGAIFFIVLMPVGLVLKIIRWDAMHRKFDREAVTYRVPTLKPPAENLEKPF